MYVLFPVSVREVLDLQKRYADKGGFGAVAVKLILADGSAYKETGALDYIDPSVATTTDTLTLRARIPNPLRAGAKAGDIGSRELVDGEFVTAQVEGVEPIKALAIPRTSVLSDQQGYFVYVLGPDNKAERRAIILGQSTPELAIVASGLKEGETIIADGLQKVRPGGQVVPAPLGAPPAAPPGAPPAKG
jgi:membrane fusion protein (multidrug efflux system)